MYNGLSFGKGVLFSSKCGYVGRTGESNFNPAFSKNVWERVVLYSPYGGKYRHLFLYSKRKRIRKKNHWNAVVEMLLGGKT